jgi:hypothetical protein
MKPILGALVLLMASASVFAAERHGDAVAAEIEAILQEESDTVVSDLTFGKIDDLLGRLSIRIQEDAYVRRSGLASRMLPGLGQFMNGATLDGALYLAGDLVVVAGTIVATYFLLPPALQLSNLDYFNTPVATIRDTWTTELESMTFVKALPTVGVMAAGAVLHTVLSIASSRQAQRLARERIERGEVVFEPRLALLHTGGPLALGMGFGLKYR